MITQPVRKSALKEIAITRNELNQLIFWAEIGYKNRKKKLNKIQGGSYYPEVIQTIEEYKNLISKITISL